MKATLEWIIFLLLFGLLHWILKVSEMDDAEIQGFSIQRDLSQFEAFKTGHPVADEKDIQRNIDWFYSTYTSFDPYVVIHWDATLRSSLSDEHQKLSHIVLNTLIMNMVDVVTGGADSVRYALVMSQVPQAKGFFDFLKENISQIPTETHFTVLDIVAVMTAEEGGNEEIIQLMMEDDEVAYRAAVFLSLCHRVAAISPSDDFIDAWETLKEWEMQHGFTEAARRSRLAIVRYTRAQLKFANDYMEKKGEVDQLLKFFNIAAATQRLLTLYEEAKDIRNKVTAEEVELEGTRSGYKSK